MNSPETILAKRAARVAFPESSDPCFAQKVALYNGGKLLYHELHVVVLWDNLG